MPVLLNMAIENSNNFQKQDNSDLSSNEVNDNMTDDDESSQEVLCSSTELSMPNVAVPEKIILCIDIYLQDNITGYFMKNSTDSFVSTTDVLKKALVLFIMNKLSLNKNTKLALVLMSDEVKWVTDFTNDLHEIVNSVNNIKFVSTDSNAKNYSLTPVFQKIHEKIVLPQEEYPAIMPPSEVYRTIIIYNSSTYSPELDFTDHCYKNLIASPYFVLDILYLHEKQSQENKCQDIFNNLVAMCKVTSYVLEVSRSVTKVFNNFAKLLPHPFQRVHLGILSNNYL